MQADVTAGQIITHDGEGVPGPLPSGRHGLPRDYVISSQRSRLLQAAVRIAGADGYANMTVSAMIAHARVSRKTFYELFRDREDIFLAAYDLIATGAVERSRTVFGTEGPWAVRLCRVLRHGLAALAAHPHETRVGFVEVLAAGPRALERRDATMRAFTEFLTPGYDLVETVPGAERTMVPQLMPEAIIGALYEIVYARVLNDRIDELPDLLPDLLYCALAPFFGPATATEQVTVALESLDAPAGAR